MWSVQKPQEAMEYFEKCFELDAEDPWILKTHVDLGYIYLKKEKNIEKALKAFQDGIDFGKSHAAADLRRVGECYFYIGKIYGENLNKKKEALIWIDKGIQLGYDTSEAKRLFEKFKKGQ